jgi:hypothetical protein
MTGLFFCEFLRKYEPLLFFVLLAKWIGMIRKSIRDDGVKRYFSVNCSNF